MDFGWAAPVRPQLPSLPSLPLPLSRAPRSSRPPAARETSWPPGSSPPSPNRSPSCLIFPARSSSSSTRRSPRGTARTWVSAPATWSGWSFSRRRPGTRRSAGSAAGSRCDRPRAGSRIASTASSCCRASWTSGRTRTTAPASSPSPPERPSRPGASPGGSGTGRRPAPRARRWWWRSCSPTASPTGWSRTAPAGSTSGRCPAVSTCCMAHSTRTATTSSTGARRGTRCAWRPTVPPCPSSGSSRTTARART